MILSFDTSGPHCVAALLRDGEVLGSLAEDMSRGQAERLIPLLEDCLAQGGADWRDLEALAVGIGPGNFTGTRISVSAARGLALGLGIPAIGVSMFEAVAFGRTGPLLVILPAPRDRAYAQRLDNGLPSEAPQLIDPGNPADALRVQNDLTVIGHLAAEIGRHLGLPAVDIEPAELPDLAARIGRVAGLRLSDRQDKPARPAPLYVRPADAAPPSDPPPVILDA